MDALDRKIKNTLDRCIYNCKHRSVVLCDGETDCSRCGWFKDEEERRKRRIREEAEANGKRRRHAIPAE